MEDTVMNRIPTLLLGEEPMGTQDDRMLPITRLVGVIIIPILLVASAILYGFPDRTEELFAWTITPEMTPMIMGAGYATGVYFFYRVSTIDEWHRVSHVFPGIAVFTWFMAAATFLHWENFNHNHLTFYAWTFLYIVAPVLIPALWWINRQTDPGPTGSGLEMPPWLRAGAGVSGVLISVTALVLFVAPDLMIDNWPWAVSPLTSRILLGWFAIFGVANVMVALDTRWTAARILVHSQIIGFSLLLIGAVRAWDNFDTDNVTFWPVLGGLVGYLLVVFLIYLYMERRGEN